MIAFFDMFDYPLTALEIWQNLGIKGELIEVMEALEDETPLIPPLSAAEVGQAGGRIMESRNGFYYLAGRSSIMEERQRRYNYSDRKFKRALWIAKIFKFIPWIKLIALGNLMGADNLRNDSDIDLFIITEEKRVWLTRFFCVGLIKLLGLRPRAGNSRDKICLSFFISEKAMDLSGLMLTPPAPTLSGREFNPPYPPFTRGAEAVDIYFIYWLANLTPLYDKAETYEKFVKANLWLKNYLPNWSPVIEAARRQVKPPSSGFYRDLVDLFIGGLEPQLKALELKLLPAELKNLMNRDSRVVIDDNIIKLHANDRREEYGEKFESLINKLLN